MHTLIPAEIPFVRLLLPLIAGIITFLFFPFLGSWNAAHIATCISVFVLFIILVLGYRKFNIYRNNWIPGIVLHCTIYLFGIVLSIQKCGKWDDDHFSRYDFDSLIIKVSDVLKSPDSIGKPKNSNANIRFEALVVQGCRKGKFYPVTGKLMVSVRVGNQNSFNCAYGDLFCIPSNYTWIEAAKNPSEFDYSKVLANRSLFHQVFLESRHILLLKTNTGNILIDKFLKLRKKLVKKYIRYITNREAASLISALILGYRSSLDRDLVNTYSKTGTMHVLSVSGMHVGIVFFVLIFLLKFMDKTKHLRLFRALLIILLIWMYALLTGLSSAVLRAAYMLTFVVIGKALNRSINNYNILAISAFILLLINPYFLVDAGFQLSYLAMLGLIYIYPKIYHSVVFQNYAADKLWSCLAISLAAQLATFPLSIYYFHQFPLYFLISNLFILIPVTLIMYAGLLFLFIPWPAVLWLFGRVLEWLTGMMNKGLYVLENLPYSSITNLWITGIECVLIYFLMIFLLNAFTFRSKKLIWLFACLCMVLSSVSMIKKIGHLNQKKIVFYSIRRHTAIGFMNAKEAHVVTDIPEKDNMFSFSVQPSFSSSGIAKIRKWEAGKSTKSESLVIHSNFVQFRNWRMLIWDQSFNYKSYSQPVNVDIVLLRNNPNLRLGTLNKSVTFRMLVFDNTNSDKRIEDWRKEAEEMHVRYYILKNSKALVINI